MATPSSEEQKEQKDQFLEANDSENSKEDSENIFFISNESRTNITVQLLKQFLFSSFLVLPGSFQQGGFLFGTIAIFVSGLFNYIAMVYYIQLRHRIGHTLRDMVYKRFGGRGVLFVDLCQFFDNYSTIYVYVCLLRIIMSHLLHALSIDLSAAWIGLLQLVLFYPLSSMRMLTKLPFLDTISHFALALGPAVVIYFSVEQLSQRGPGAFYVYETNSWLMCLGIVSCCFTSPYEILEIHDQTLLGARNTTFKNNLFFGFILNTVIYLAFSATVYYAFGQKTEPVIIYQLIGEDWFVILMKILYILAAWPQYPNNFEPLNHIFQIQMGIKHSTLTMTVFDTISEDEFIEDDVEEEERNEPNALNRHPRNRYTGSPKEEITIVNWGDIQKNQISRELRFKERVRLRKKNRNKIVLINIFKFLILVSIVILSLLSADIMAFVFAIFGCLFGMPIYFIIPGYLYWIYGNHRGSMLSKLLTLTVIAFGAFLMIAVPGYYFFSTYFIGFDETFV